MSCQPECSRHQLASNTKSPFQTFPSSSIEPRLDPGCEQCPNYNQLSTLQRQGSRASVVDMIANMAVMNSFHANRQAQAVSAWSEAISNAMAKRHDWATFEKTASELAIRYSLSSPAALAELLLRPNPPFDAYALDPRALEYTCAMLRDGSLVDLAGVLKALYKYSSLHGVLPREDAGVGEQQEGVRETVRWECSYQVEEAVLFMMFKELQQQQQHPHQVSQPRPWIKTSSDAVLVLGVVVVWMELFTKAAMAFSGDTFGVYSLEVKAAVEAARNGFALFLVALMENGVVLKMLSQYNATAVRKRVWDSLASFTPPFMQSHPDIFNRLEIFRTQTLTGFEPMEKKKETELNGYLDLIGLPNVQIPDLPVVNTRAGLYIYLNAALVGRPTVEDDALYTFLHNRYKGDLQSEAIQLILASFDVVANSVYRNEGGKSGHVLKSFLVNKVPLMLKSLAASSAGVYPFDAEYCITQALGQVDTNIFPTLSNMFDMSNTSTSFHDSVRQDFCFSCQLHGLLSETVTETLLGEITYQSLPEEGVYEKETLIQQCMQDGDRTLKLIAELDKMDGNVGAASQALVEMVCRLCRDKETMTLRQICGQLASKPLSLDVMLLFDKAGKLLHPLCELLDGWRYDDDQGEYQPSYEEFGTVLLLLMAFVYRYNLSPADLGIRAPDSFVAEFISCGHASRRADEISELERSQLGGWIVGLFDSDAGGLGDDLMRSCPPNNLLLLVPTLFDQIILALATGSISEETVRSGFEYLVEPFLLPWLVPAIFSLCDSLWAADPQTDHRADTIIRVLHLLLNPNITSNEASNLFSSVLNIVAKPLEHALRTYQQREPKCHEIEPLLGAFKELVPLSRFTAAADQSELSNWMSLGGGLSGALRNTIQHLVQWCQNPGLHAFPASYTHRQTLVALQMLGARQVLMLILEEVHRLTEEGNGSAALDVATTLICAPSLMSDTSVPPMTSPSAAATVDAAFLAPRQGRISLRGALKAEAADYKTYQKEPQAAAMAETLVRLHRRVEEMLALPPPPVLMDAAGAAALVDVDHAMVAAAAATGDAAGLNAAAAAAASASMDLGTGGAAGLGDLTGMGNMGVGGDDIFSGLAGGDFGADFASWDAMDSS